MDQYLKYATTEGGDEYDGSPGYENTAASTDGRDDLSTAASTDGGF
jgi:hypothetical protein